MATITFQGRPLQTSGELPAVGTKAPQFTLVNGQLADVTLTTYAGKKKVLNIVPSLDTPVCAISTRKFNQQASNMDNTVVLIIAADLPFAMTRFCDSEGLDKVVTLSTMRGANFMKDYGVYIADSAFGGITARAVIVLDESDTIIHAELVPEIANEPNYDAAMAALKK